MKILFRLRHIQDGMAIIYARITLDKKRCKTDFTTGLKLKKTEWNPKRQEAKNKPDINDLLEIIKQRLREIYTDQVRAGIVPDPDKIREIYLGRQETKGSLIGLFDLFLAEKKQIKVTNSVANGEVTKTYETYKTRYNLLKRYLEASKQMSVKAESVTPQWGKDFFNWMLTKKYTNNYMAKNIYMLRQVLKWGKESELIKANNIGYFNIKTDPPEYPIYLEAHELAALMQTRFVSLPMQKASDCFVFQCLTGFSYAELRQFDKQKHVSKWQEREYILIKRKKTKQTSRVPIHPKVSNILAKYPEGLPVKSIQLYNRTIKQLLTFVMTDERAALFSSHNARKTAAMNWLNLGFSIESVSYMLGHENTNITQSTYAKVLPDRIFREADKVGWL